MAAGNVKKSGSRALVMYGVSFTADALQVLADATGIGVGASEVAEPFIGAGLLGLFKAYGINVLTNPKRIMSMVGGGAADAVTGGAAPFWTVDVWYILNDAKREEAMIAEQTEQAKWEQGGVEASNRRNFNGRREPPSQVARANQEANRDGYRRNGNIRPTVE